MARSGVIAEQVLVPGPVAHEGLLEHGRQGFVAQPGDLEAVLPQTVVHGDRVLGSHSLGRHTGTVSAAYAMPQRIGVRVAHFGGCCHGSILTAEQGDCLGGLPTQCLGSTVSGARPHQGSTNPRQLAGVAGIGDNHTLTGSVAKMTLASVVPNCADITYPVLCGTCPDALGEHDARYAVEYGIVDVNAEPDGDRLFTCLAALGETYADAEARNRSFVPPFVAPLRVKAPVPTCPFCSAEYYECTTDWRGLCVAGSVSA